jgi:hypothetical protein
MATSQTSTALKSWLEKTNRWCLVGGVLVTCLAASALLGGCDRRNYGDAGMSCIINLRAIEGAKANWALENRKMTNDIPTDKSH